MWNDSNIPLAYLITFRAYGTWLHGDLRGSVDRRHNLYGSSKIPHDPVRKTYVKATMKRRPVRLDAEMRRAVESAIRETCLLRGWKLLALNIRTNHAHAVVAMGAQRPETALSAFKANATRTMRELGLWTSHLTPWVAKGSTRYLWTEASVGNAVFYVRHMQGDELPDF